MTGLGFGSTAAVFGLRFRHDRQRLTSRLQPPRQACPRGGPLRTAGLAVRSAMLDDTGHALSGSRTQLRLFEEREQY